MKKSYLSVILLLLMWSLSSIAESVSNNSEQTIQWQPYSNTIFKQAQAGNRLILLYGKAEWCHWCQKMAATTLQDADVIKLIQTSFLPVLIDVDKDSQIAAQYKITDLPATIIMTSQQKILQTYSGYMEPKDYLHDLSLLASQSVSTHEAQATSSNSVITKPSMTNTTYQQLLQKELLIYKNAINSNWGIDAQYKYFDAPSLEFAMSIGVEGN